MHKKMKIICLFTLLGVSLPLFARVAEEPYDYRERTRQLAFDPARFFTERNGLDLFISVRYTGDDYGYPVYSIGVRKGCIFSDEGEARKSCGNRLVARMVRSPSGGKVERPRSRGQRLFGALSGKKIADDAGLKNALNEYGLEWFEADLNACAPAIMHLKTAGETKFFPTAPLPDNNAPFDIILHADKIELLFGEYLERVRYYGLPQKDNPGGWADDFAKSLESCWVPATAVVPWHVPNR